MKEPRGADPGVADDNQRPSVPYPTMVALRDAHAQLLKRYREDRDSLEILTAMEEFLSRGRVTGTLLDTDRDRSAAQSLLDYWATILYRASGDRHHEATLNDFAPGTVGAQLSDSQYPYPHLKPVTEEDQVPFGRRQLVDDCLQKMRASPHHLLVIVGPSCSGRSSLVRGGLLPALKSGRLPGSKDWYYFKWITPGTEPLVALADILESAEADGNRKSSTTLGRLRKGGGYFTQRVRALINQPVVLVVDRLEELFTRCQDETDRRAFVVHLLDLINDPGVRQRVILILKSGEVEKQFARLDPRFAKLLEESRYLMPPPDAKDLREAMTRPSEQVGLKFEERLTEQIAEDLVGHPAALPLLQFLLRKLWEKREGNRITWAAYNSLGRRTVVDKCSEAMYAALSREERETARRLMLRLVQPGLADKELVTASVPRAELAPEGEDPAQVERVFDRLVEAGLIRVRPGTDRVEVIHEALVGQWRRLLEWVERERTTTGQRALLARAAQAWFSLSRDSTALWQGALLEKARSYPDLTPLESEFIIASQAAQAVTEKWKRQLAYLLLAAALLIAFLLGLSLWKEHELRLKKQDLIDKEKELNLKEKKFNSQITSQKIALQSVLLQDERPDLALLLSLKGFDYGDTPEARSSVFRSVEVNQRLERFLHGHQSDVFSVVYSPDGKLLASAGADEVIRLWDADTGQPLSDVLDGKQGIIRCLAFTHHEGKLLLASGGTDGRVLLWDVKTSRFAELTAPTGGAGADDAHLRTVRSLALSPDGALLAAGSGDGTLRLWDVATRKLLRDFKSGGRVKAHEGSVNCLAFNHDGQALASGGYDRMMRLWKIPSGAPFYGTAESSEYNYSSGDFINGVAFSRNSTWLATVTGDGSCLLWSAPLTQRTSKLQSPTPLARSRSVNAFTGLAFSPDSDLLAATTSKREVIVWNASTRQLVDTPLRGHQDVVWAVAFRPETGGKHLASASGDHNVILWDIRERLPLGKTPIGHAGPIMTLAAHPQDEWLASGGSDGKVFLWNTATRERFDQPLLLPYTYPVAVVALACSPDGNLLAAVDEEGAICLWNVRDATKPEGPKKYQSPQGKITGIAFDPDGRWFAACGTDGLLRLWSVDGPEANGPQNQQALLDLAIAKNARGTTLATGDASGTIQLWSVVSTDPKNHLPVIKPAGKPFSVPRLICLVLSRDGRWLAAGDKEGTIRLWDLTPAEPSPVAVSWKHEKTVRSLTFNQDGTLLASASDDTTVGLWDVTAKKGQRFSRHRDNVFAVAFANRTSILASAGKEMAIALWDVVGPPNLDLKKNGGPLGRIDVHSVVFDPTPDSPLLFSGHANGTINRWDTDRVQRLGQPLLAHNGRVTSLAMSPDGKCLASGGKDEWVRFWDVGKDHELHPRQLVLKENGAVRSLTFSPDGKRVAYSREKNGVWLSDTTTGESVKLPGHDERRTGSLLQRIRRGDVSIRGQEDLEESNSYFNWASSVSFRPASNTLASATADKAILLVDAGSHQPIGEPLVGNSVNAWSLAFSPDGQLLAFGSDDGTVLWWDLRDLQNPKALNPPLTRHNGIVRALAFSPDNKLLASGGAGGLILLWDVPSQIVLGLPLSGHQRDVNSLSFRSDSKVLASAGADGTIRLWDVSLDSMKKRAQSIANRYLSTAETAKYVSDKPD